MTPVRASPFGRNNRGPEKSILFRPSISIRSPSVGHFAPSPPITRSSPLQFPGRNSRESRSLFIVPSTVLHTRVQIDRTWKRISPATVGHRHNNTATVQTERKNTNECRQSRNGFRLWVCKYRIDSTPRTVVECPWNSVFQTICVRTHR